MLNLLRKIIKTGIVTEVYDKAPAPERFRGEVISILNERCTGCQTCVKACPSQALGIQNGVLEINHKACLFCGRCVELCEQQILHHTSNYKLTGLQGSLAAESGELLKKQIRRILGRSMHIRHVDVGSCNACDFEMTAMLNPIYDIQQYGIDFVASPRHADLLMVTGVVTRNLTQALRMTFDAAAEPKLVMAVGACAASGQTFGSTYAVNGGADAILPVDIYVPGCPPRPQALIYGLLLALDRL